jgi:3-hydroxymyristoyl/3-hydroxydecanoyl-(acyl carrier protein) dehydratase
VIERELQPDHPASRGHFPGNPIIPGAVLLSETLQAIEASAGAPLAPFSLSSAKFLHPARPGSRLVIEYSRTAAGEIGFTARVHGKTVLTGRLRCRNAAKTNRSAGPAP